MQSYTEGDYNDNNPSASSGEKYTYTYGGVSATKTDSLGSKTYQWAFSGVANDATQTFDPVTGLVISETMQAGNTVSYTYSARGNVATATPGVSGGPIWTYTYDSNYPDSISAITSSQPSQWAGWKYLYYNGVNGGPPGALMQVNRVGTDGVTITTVATFSYDAKGHATSHIDSLGNVRLYSYNALGDLTSVTSSGNTTSYDHDALGRVTKMTTPSGHATTYNYDDDDRVKSVTLPSPATIPTLDFTTRMSYDNFDATTGLVSTVSTDPNGHTTTAGYDALGHLVRAADAKGNVTQYSYQYNLPHSITDANSNVTSYSYNADRYLVKTTFFDGTFETYAVNAFGGVTSVTDRRGQPTNYLYDGYGRPTSNAMGSYAYAGQNLTFGDGVSYTYDSQWHVATETQAGGDVITYTYGSGSDLLASYRVDRPAGQPGASVTATFGYDSSGRVVSLQWSPAGSFNFSYNADGQYSVIQFPNGQTRTFTYDGPGRLATLANGDLTFSYGYDYDWPSQSYASLGNRTSVNVSGLAGQYPNGTTKYIYDAAQQLTGVTHANGTTSSYTYDAIGNRTLAVIGGGTNPYIYYQNAASKNTPRLRNALGPDLTYDANGNLTTYGYTWDAANRLTAISSIPIHYQYDFQGRRNLYTPGTGSPVRYVSWGMNTIAERSTDTTRSNDYAFGPGIDEPLARRASDGSIQYYLVDGLGSVVALTSATGDITSTATYDEFGVTSSVDLFGYTGRELASSAFNLWNYRARYYRADWGRFISEDPMPPPWGDLNIYRYVTNNPVRFSDPTGMYCCGQSFLECLGECLAEGDPLAGVKKLPLTLTTPIPKAVPKFFGLSTKGFAGASKWTTPANVLNQATGGGKAALKWGGKVAWAAQIGYGTFLFGLEAFCSAECAQDKCAFLP
jgi:RHS repeat-associated protein